MTIVLNSTNGDTLYDFQVGINIPYYTGMQDDFDDIRFTTNDEVTSIPYWIEEFNPSDYAIARYRYKFGQKKICRKIGG